jgi:ParB family chromosome partitioning protein
MSEEKPNQQEHLRFKREDFNGYFPKSYTEQQIKKDILKGLELLHRHRQRNKDAR